MCAWLGSKVEETFGFTTSYCATKGAMRRLRKVLLQEKRLDLSGNKVIAFLYLSDDIGTFWHFGSRCGFSCCFGPSGLNRQPCISIRFNVELTLKGHSLALRIMIIRVTI